MKLLVGFLAGLAVGLIVSGAYMLSLKATLRFYLRYIHERLDQQWTGVQHGEIPDCSTSRATLVPRKESNINPSNPNTAFQGRARTRSTSKLR